MTGRLRGRRYLTVAEFAARTGLSPSMVRERCGRGCYRVKPSRSPREHYQIVASEVGRELRERGR